MPELTKVERDRLDVLKAKTPHPSSIPLAEGVRTEGEEIEHRRLAERLEGEERLAELRKQDVRTPEEYAAMRLLGASEEEIKDGQRRQAAVDEKEAQRTPAEMTEHNRAIGAHEPSPNDAQRVADEAASPAATQRANSDRIARDVDRVKERERLAREPDAVLPSDGTVRPADGTAAPTVTGSLANQAATKAHADRIAALKAMPKRTPEQDKELAGLEGSAG